MRTNVFTSKIENIKIKSTKTTTIQQIEKRKGAKLTRDRELMRKAKKRLIKKKS